MTTATVEADLDQQALSKEQAAATLARYQELWNRADLDGLLDGFTDNITVEFADLPPINGKAELEAVLRARMARQKNYRLKKTLRAVSGNTIIGTWTADWIDGATGRAMQGKGTEFIQMRDGKCAHWEATFNAWNAEGPRHSLFT